MTVGGLIALVLGNIPMLGLALAAALPVILKRFRQARPRLDLLLTLGLGIPMVRAAFFHLVLPAIAARLIGWAPRPFQREVGYADLAMGIVASLAAARPLPFKGAIVWTLAIALFGDAAAHIKEIGTTRDFAPGNAGLILWWDVLAPSYGLRFWSSQGGHRDLMGKHPDRASSPAGKPEIAATFHLSLYAFAAAPEGATSFPHEGVTVGLVRGSSACHTRHANK